MKANRRSRGTCLRQAGLVLVLMTAVAVPQQAYAQSYGANQGAAQGTLQVSDTTPQLGQSITASGTGFAGTAPVTLILESTPRTVATATADGSGRFSTSVTIPTDSRLGAHTLSARGKAADDGTLVLSAKITITQDGNTPRNGAPLVRTGQSVGWLLLIGLAFLMIGTALVVVARRRSAGQH